MLCIVYDCGLQHSHEWLHSVTAVN